MCPGDLFFVDHYSKDPMSKRLPFLISCYQEIRGNCCMVSTSYTIVTLAQCPELEAEMPRLHSGSWPEFVLNDPVALRYWGCLFSTFADFQYVLCDENGEALAAGHSGRDCSY